MNVLLDTILKTIATALATALVGYVAKLLQKVHYDVSAAQEARFKYIVQQAVLTTEESLSQKVLDVSRAKLTSATAYVRAHYPHVPILTIQDAIHAELAAQRGGVGPKGQ